jgi:hypothetical protein
VEVLWLPAILVVGASSACRLHNSCVKAARNERLLSRWSSRPLRVGGKLIVIIVSIQSWMLNLNFDKMGVVKKKCRKEENREKFDILISGSEGW